MTNRKRSWLGILLAVATLSVAAWRASPGELNPSPPVGELAQPAPQAQYWKGNLHTHSLWSDGDDFPEMIADWYKRHDYNFLALTEHNVLAVGTRWIDAAEKAGRAAAVAKYRARFGDDWVETRNQVDKPQVRLKTLAEIRQRLEESGRFLLIPGEEITHQYAKAPVHVNAINLAEVIKPLDGASVAETIRVQHRLVAEQQRRLGRQMLAFLNHPNYQWAITGEDLILTEELRFFEVFNGHPGVRNYGDGEHPGCERLWDVLLALRLGKLRLPVVYGLATDDAHGYHSFGIGKVNPGRGWIWVRAAQLTPEAIVQAMEAGDFYCSTGVTLDDVSLREGVLRLAVKPEPGVTYLTQFIATLRDANLESEPRRDAAGNVLNVTRVYDQEVGQVVSQVSGIQPSYKLSGKELYVRAKVVSSKKHPNPYQRGDVEVAWTQPFTP